MAMSLDYALNESDEITHIKQIKSRRGKTRQFSCPYCGESLTMQKGASPHFIHTGEPCGYVMGEVYQSTQLPLYNHFDFNLSKHDQALIHALNQRKKSLTWFDGVRFQDQDLVTYNYFWKSWQITAKGKILLGDTSLDLFALHQDEAFRRRYLKLKRDFHNVPANDNSSAPIKLANLRIYLARLQRVLERNLYLLEIQHTGGTLHHICAIPGEIEPYLDVMRRRLLPHFEEITIHTLYNLAHRGAVIEYARYRYADYQVKIGRLDGYFAFPALNEVFSDFKTLGDKVLDEFDRALLADLESSDPYALTEEEQAERLSEAIKAGMQRAAREGKHIGRPEENMTDFLEKYPEVIEAIKDGQSLRQIRKAHGIAINTVRKIKKALEAAPD